MTEEEISMILNTFMYLDYKEAKDGMKMKEILDDLSKMPDCREGGIHYGEYQVLSKAAQNPQIAELKIGNQSHLMGCDSGTAACTFQDENGSTYVVFRGTVDGEWVDNGIGMTESVTVQQQRALDYFEDVIEKQQICPQDRLIVTGHSKGGNKAQYVTLSTKYGELLDACYNIDGQGFSENAIENFKKIWGVEGYEARVDKITGIYGENDYVNVLGNSIVKAENILFVRTPVEKEHFAGYHDIKYMFATPIINTETGEITYIFHGEKNGYVTERGELGKWAKALSELMMKLPIEQREGCATVIMQLLELRGNRKSGLNGEFARWSDIEMFLKKGIPTTLSSVLATGQGWDLLSAVFKKENFTQEMKGALCCKVDDVFLVNRAEQIGEITKTMEQNIMQLAEIEKRMSVYMKGNRLLQYRLVREKEALMDEIFRVRKLTDKLKEIALLYKTRDELMAENLQIGL